MPYIRMATSRELSMGRKEEFKSGLAEIIGLIPGKTEAALTLNFPATRSLSIKNSLRKRFARWRKRSAICRRMRFI